MTEQCELLGPMHGKAVQIFFLQASFVPHQFANGTSSCIVNEHLLGLLMDSKTFFKAAAEGSLQQRSSFKFQLGGPGGGKTTFVIESVTGPLVGARNLCVVPANELLEELVGRLITKDVLVNKHVYVLGRRFDVQLPSGWRWLCSSAVDTDSEHSRRDGFFL
jgi:hypothetical protein